jgi:hypothetical protein
MLSCRRVLTYYFLVPFSAFLSSFPISLGKFFQVKFLSLAFFSSLFRRWILTFLLFTFIFLSNKKSKIMVTVFLRLGFLWKTFFRFSFSGYWFYSLILFRRSGTLLIIVMYNNKEMHIYEPTLQWKRIYPILYIDRPWWHCGLIIYLRNGIGSSKIEINMCQSICLYRCYTWLNYLKILKKLMFRIIKIQFIFWS